MARLESLGSQCQFKNCRKDATLELNGWDGHTHGKFCSQHGVVKMRELQGREERDRTIGQ